MKNILLPCFFIILTFILTSCSVSFEKRKYRPGYYIEVSNHKKNLPTPRSENSSLVKTETNRLLSIETAIVPERIEKELEVPVNTKDQKNILQNPVKKFKKKNPLLDSCDVIFTALGERIEARIIEIGDEYVQYKKCDDPKGRLYTIKTKMIDNITLRNGETFVPKDRVIVDKEKERKKSGILFGLGIAAISIAFIAFVFSFFISPFSGISFGLSIFNAFFSFIVLLLDIRPGKYVPSFRTKLTWIFCLIALVLFIAAMIIVLM